jgi:hydroxymethylglutaryl-CoA lyase
VLPPAVVKIVEVGPRDGLQSEPVNVPTAVKLELIARLAQAGLSTIEATAFVSPTWVPQMADQSEVMAGLVRRPGVAYPVLVPNLRGYQRALAAGAREIAVFVAATESFSRRNLNCSIEESLGRCAEVTQQARAHGIAVRGYVSCVLGCPYEGSVLPRAVAAVAAALYGMGCAEISLGDTIGAGTPLAARRLIEVVAQDVPLERLAGHYHDTYGMAAANIYASLEAGMRTFDSSVAGLGGCPYAPGASGNVATEDVVYLMRGLNIETGVDLERLFEAGQYICAHLERAPASRVARALQARRAAHSVASA